MSETIQPGLALMWSYVGGGLGDLSSGFLSQALASRRKAVGLLMGFIFLMTVVYLYGGVQTAGLFYGLCLILGVGTGYWALLVTIGAEQFGTNLRATAATTIPNMVRGSVIPMTLCYQAFKPALGVIQAGAVVGLMVFGLGFYALLTIPETHGKDLDYVEE